MTGSGRDKFTKYLKTVLHLISAPFLFLCAMSMNEISLADGLDDRLKIPVKGKPYLLKAIINNHPIQLLIPDHLSRLDSYPESLASNIKRRITYRDRNIDVMTRHSDNIENLINRIHLIQPLEYSLNMTEVLLSVHSSDSNSENPLYRHTPLLLRLPKYTKVHLIVPEGISAAVRKQIENIGMSGRITLHEVDTWRVMESGVELLHDTTRWAQDLLELAYDESGKNYILAPATRYQINDLSRSDNRYLKRMENRHRRVLFLPLFFRGGNVLLGRSAQRILFIGERELRNNRNDYYNSLFAFPDPDEVIALFRRITGADKVVIVKNSDNLFHIDMSVSFIGDGRAALIKPVAESGLGADDRAVIGSIEGALKENGFKITYIPTTTDRIRNFMSPVNIVIYNNIDKGATEALVPLFEDEKNDNGESLNSMIYKAYLDAGVNPIYVEDRFHSVQGNFHCVVSVLN